MNFFIYNIHLYKVYQNLLIKNNIVLKNSLFNKFFGTAFMNYENLQIFSSKFLNFLNNPIKISMIYSSIYQSRPLQPSDLITIVLNSEFHNCSTSSDGGALYITKGTVSISYSIFNNCQAYRGGVLLCDNTNSTVSFCCIMNSRALYDGHFIRVNHANFYIKLNFIGIIQCAKTLIENSHSSVCFHSGYQIIENTNASNNFITLNGLFTFYYSNFDCFFEKNTVFNNTRINNTNLGLFIIQPYQSFLLNFVNIIQNLGFHSYLFYIKSECYFNNLVIQNNKFQFINSLSFSLSLNNCYFDFKNISFPSLIQINVFYDNQEIKKNYLYHWKTALCINDPFITKDLIIKKKKFYLSISFMNYFF